MLVSAQLHASLQDPILDSLNFLNEVITRFPDAISFAPGAPHPADLTDIDITRYVNRYLQHVCHSRGIELDEAQRMLYQYGPARGIINDLLAQATSQDKGIDVPPEAIVVTVGAQEAMLIVLRALFRSSKDRLAVVTPCFVGILGAARLLDIEVVGIDEGEDGLNLESLDAVCQAARSEQRPIRALYVAPDYSNPAGSVLNLHTREALLELAGRHDLYLIEDNAYGFTAPAGVVIPTLKALDKTQRVIFIATFAKICLPGARVGYVIADQQVLGEDLSTHLLADDLAMIKSMITVNTSPICQALIGGILLERGGAFLTLEQEKSVRYQHHLQVLLNALERHLPAGISWNRPQGGFFVRLRLPIPVDMQLLELSASQYGVLWTPMSSFYLNQGGHNELRLSCSYLSPEKIEEGIERFAVFLHEVVEEGVSCEQEA